ncbi:C39 family peptidase [Paenibacillus sp. MSJ-34]|uniref:C39 family peptidase n=1 Tax=Paenibacillus sp. MSJ-34 TaxID=2841529 RepID=UPI001C102BE4|nr:C39 family peptidase [Paenibacillus sp. MSJ-34]MBU5445199.1 C39 family peptidase [Paenibacillus sp. MSJ-34]
MMRKLKSKHLMYLCAVFVMSFTLFVGSAGVSAASKTLSLTRIQQAKTNWCWAAASEMVGKYKNSSTTKTQWDVVLQEKGKDYPNVGGTVSNIKNGIKLVGGNKVTVTDSSSPLSFATIQSQIDSANPSVMWIDWNSGGAHVVVSAGYDTTDSKVYAVDPWEDISNQYYKYDALVKGTTLASGTGKYTKSIYLK